jgi:hypothetical protein
MVHSAWPFFTKNTNLVKKVRKVKLKHNRTDPERRGSIGNDHVAHHRGARSREHRPAHRAGETLGLVASGDDLLARRADPGGLAAVCGLSRKGVVASSGGSRQLD